MSIDTRFAHTLRAFLLSIRREEDVFIMSEPIPYLVPRIALGPNGDCPICIEPQLEGELIVEPDCKHIFHDHCLSEWMKTKQTCPLCRARIKGDMSL
jgi:hypothetical protein